MNIIYLHQYYNTSDMVFIPLTNEGMANARGWCP